MLSLLCLAETMGFGKRAAELAEAKAQSLQHDDVIVSLCSDDANTLANVRKIESSLYLRYYAKACNENLAMS